MAKPKSLTDHVVSWDLITPFELVYELCSKIPTDVSSLPLPQKTSELSKAGLYSIYVHFTWECQVQDETSGCQMYCTS
jgi:hypothetical protein